jgi:magnesium transporter
MERYGIDEHTLSSATDPDEVSRIEIDTDYFAIIWKIPRRFVSDGSFSFEVSSMGLFVFASQLLIVLPEESPLFDKRHFSKINSIRDVFLRLLSSSIYHFMGHLRVIDAISNEIKTKVNTSMENKFLLQMFDLSESLVYYLNAISANNTVLEKLRINPRKLNLSTDELELLEDVAIDATQCYKQAEIYSSILTGLMDARGTVVNNNVNTLLKRLTIINTIFLPLNLLASIGGMSEYSVWTGHISWQLAYAVFILAMVVIGALMFVIIDPSTRKIKRTR